MFPFPGYDQGIYDMVNCIMIECVGSAKPVGMIKSVENVCKTVTPFNQVLGEGGR